MKKTNNFKKALVTTLMVAAFATESNALPQIDNTKTNTGLWTPPIVKGDTLFINQDSKVAKVHWVNFDTAGNETVKVNQGGSNYVLINKVTGDMPTNFLGKLTAPGKVVIQNENGINLGAGSQFNVGSLTATTARNFNVNPDGTYTASDFSKNPVNFDGTVNAQSGGYVYALAKNINVGDNATITAPNGSVQLQTGAGQYVVDLKGTGQINYSVGDNADKSSITTGAHSNISAKGGDVVIRATANDIASGVINLNGVVDTNQFDNVAQGKGGSITVNSSGALNQNGTLQSYSRFARGGDVTLVSRNSDVNQNGTINVGAGSKAGGDINVRAGNNINSNGWTNTSSLNNVAGNITMAANGRFNDGANSRYVATGYEGGGNVDLSGKRFYGSYDAQNGKPEVHAYTSSIYKKQGTVKVNGSNRVEILPQ